METISHKGKVTKLADGQVTVEIISESACSACHAKSVCSMGDSAVKTIQIDVEDSSLYSEAEEVDVLLASSLGHKAVWLGYVLPLILLVAFILLPLSLGCSEGISALCGLAAVALCYSVLFFLRKRMSRKWTFTIRKH